VLILIYALVVGWFQSFVTPLVIHGGHPFSLVASYGPWPDARLLHGYVHDRFHRRSGIVVRNSIILVDFVELAAGEGMPLEAAVIDAGAVRFRPMMLTPAAVVVGPP